MMNKNNFSWKPLTLHFNNKLNEALVHQHHAAQFIALTGRHLIDQQPDDSNTTMEFLQNQNLLIGKPLHNGYQVALQLSNLTIKILDEHQVIKNEIILEGKNKLEVFNELKQKLSELGIAVKALKNELHYELSPNKLDNGTVFSGIHKNDFIENSIYRHNANFVLNKFASLNENADPVGIWPHHFDTASFVPVSYNQLGGLTKSIGFGWAIPDSMVSEPYYYLSFWSEKPIVHPKNLKPLDSGQWMLPDWNGAILKHADIILQKTAVDQYEMVNSFFNQGAEILFNHLKNI